jgi:transketolase
VKDKTVENSFDDADSKARCLKYRKRILEVSQQVGAIHLAPALSSVEIVDSIYNGLMKVDDQGNSDDAFIMSKGHGCMIQYVVLEERGILTREDLDLYCKPGGRLGCHPDYGNPGIEASTGSLGHGLGLSVGMAYTDRYVNKNENKIFTVISDGELQEGSTWENMMMGANLGVDNLIVFLDNNGMQSFGNTIDTHPQLYPIKEKVEAFGWETTTVDGHDAQAIYNAVKARKGGKPFMVICDTVKGKGVSYMEGVPIWHFRAPNPEEYKLALAELNGEQS